MDILAFIFFMTLFGVLAYLGGQRIVFRTNTKRAAHKLGLIYARAGGKTVYEGLCAGRILRIETKTEGWGKTAQMRIHYIVTTSLPSHIYLRLKIRPYAASLTEGGDITTEQLFEIEGYPKQLLTACFESQVEFKFKFIEGIKLFDSKSKPVIEIRDKCVCLEHGNLTLKSEQIVWLFSLLSLLANVFEAHGKG